MPADTLSLLWTSASPTPGVEEVDEAERCLERLGLRQFSLREAGRGLAARRALYELVRIGVVDASRGDDGFVPFEQFDGALFEPYYWHWADDQTLVSDGDVWVGLANLQLRNPEQAEMGITVVRRSYRRQGIGRALKVLALARARRHGVASVATQNRADNTAILRLNAALGFVRR